MRIFFLVAIGFVVGILNLLTLKFTIKKMLEFRNHAVVIPSLLIRTVFVCSVFLLFLDRNWKNAIFMLLGLTVSKI